MKNNFLKKLLISTSVITMATASVINPAMATEGTVVPIPFGSEGLVPQQIPTPTAERPIVSGLKSSIIFDTIKLDLNTLKPATQELHGEASSYTLTFKTEKGIMHIDPHTQTFFLIPAAAEAEIAPEAAALGGALIAGTTIGVTVGWFLTMGIKDLDIDDLREVLVKSLKETTSLVSSGTYVITNLGDVIQDLIDDPIGSLKHGTQKLVCGVIHLWCPSAPKIELPKLDVQVPHIDESAATEAMMEIIQRMGGITVMANLQPEDADPFSRLREADPWDKVLDDLNLKPGIRAIVNWFKPYAITPQEVVASQIQGKINEEILKVTSDLINKLKNEINKLDGQANPVLSDHFADNFATLLYRIDFHKSPYYLQTGRLGSDGSRISGSYTPRSVIIPRNSFRPIKYNDFTVEPYHSAILAYMGILQKPTLDGTIVFRDFLLYRDLSSDQLRSIVRKINNIKSFYNNPNNYKQSDLINTLTHHQSLFTPVLSSLRYDSEFLSRLSQFIHMTLGTDPISGYHTVFGDSSVYQTLGITYTNSHSPAHFAFRTIVDKQTTMAILNAQITALYDAMAINNQQDIDNVTRTIAKIIGKDINSLFELRVFSGELLASLNTNYLNSLKDRATESSKYALEHYPTVHLDRKFDHPDMKNLLNIDTTSSVLHGIHFNNILPYDRNDENYRTKLRAASVKLNDNLKIIYDNLPTDNTLNDYFKQSIFEVAKLSGMTLPEKYTDLSNLDKENLNLFTSKFLVALNPGLTDTLKQTVTNSVNKHLSDVYHKIETFSKSDPDATFSNINKMFLNPDMLKTLNITLKREQSQMVFNDTPDTTFATSCMGGFMGGFMGGMNPMMSGMPECPVITDPIAQVNDPRIANLSHLLSAMLYHSEQKLDNNMLLETAREIYKTTTGQTIAMNATDEYGNVIKDESGVPVINPELNLFVSKLLFSMSNGLTDSTKQLITNALEHDIKPATRLALSNIEQIDIDSFNLKTTADGKVVTKSDDGTSVNLNVETVAQITSELQKQQQAKQEFRNSLATLRTQATSILAQQKIIDDKVKRLQELLSSKVVQDELANNGEHAAEIIAIKEALDSTLSSNIKLPESVRAMLRAIRTTTSHAGTTRAGTMHVMPVSIGDAITALNNAKTEMNTAKTAFISHRATINAYNAAAAKLNNAKKRVASLRAVIHSVVSTPFTGNVMNSTMRDIANVNQYLIGRRGAQGIWINGNIPITKSEFTSKPDHIKSKSDNVSVSFGIDYKTNTKITVGGFLSYAKSAGEGNIKTDKSNIGFGAYGQFDLNNNIYVTDSVAYNTASFDNTIKTATNRSVSNLKMNSISNEIGVGLAFNNMLNLETYLNTTYFMAQDFDKKVYAPGTTTMKGTAKTDAVLHNTIGGRLLFKTAESIMTSFDIRPYAKAFFELGLSGNELKGKYTVTGTTRSVTFEKMTTGSYGFSVGANYLVNDMFTANLGYNLNHYGSNSQTVNIGLSANF